MISDEIRSAIDAEIARYPQRRGALLPALHRVQQEHGYVSADVAAELAEIFEIRPIDVLEVVSFYNMFYDRPQPRHHVYVCTNLPCSLRGARTLLRQLEAHVGAMAGEPTADGPMLRVDDTYHEDLDAERAKRILDELE